MKTTVHYRNEARFKHPEVSLEQARRVIENPMHTETQDDGKVRYYGEVTILKNGREVDMIARVITLADGETLHTAFVDYRLTNLIRSIEL